MKTSLDYPEIFALWAFSSEPAVRAVASNSDAMRQLIKYLKPMQNHNEVIREYNDPRYHQALIWRQPIRLIQHACHSCETTVSSP